MSACGPLGPGSRRGLMFVAVAREVTTDTEE
jgi:hypothetical protein